MMMTHSSVWRAIDQLAERKGVSLAELARSAGLDRTTFARCKRSRDGRPRWPSTESISRVLVATDCNMAQFSAMLREGARQAPQRIPVIGFAQAGRNGFFDDSGYPTGSGWDVLDFPNLGDSNAYALKISGDSMEPVYRDGDLVVVSPLSAPRPGDRVVVRTTADEVLAKQLVRQTTRTIHLASVNRAHGDLVLPAREVVWISRIVWVSQ